MSRAFEFKKRALTKTAREYAARSSVLRLLMIDDTEDEWRGVFELNTSTLVLLPQGEVQTAAPVVLGIRYHERFLAEAPHPFEIVTVLEPMNIFHPNVARSAMCLGHPQAGLPLELILNQAWAGLTLNMNIVNTVPGQIANTAAADYVRANAHKYPLTSKGLLE